MLNRCHLDWTVRAAEPERWPFLHPGRSAEVEVGPQDGEPTALGFLGEVHPLVAASWDLPRTAAFAIDLGKLALAAPEITSFVAFGAFPVLRQAIPVALPAVVAGAEAVAAAREAGGGALGGAGFFAEARGEPRGEGRGSQDIAL